jgi:hypothetical protein
MAAKKKRYSYPNFTAGNPNALDTYMRGGKQIRRPNGSRPYGQVRADIGRADLGQGMAASGLAKNFAPRKKRFGSIKKVYKGV